MSPLRHPVRVIQDLIALPAPTEQAFRLTGETILNSLQIERTPDRYLEEMRMRFSRCSRGGVAIRLFFQPRTILIVRPCIPHTKRSAWGR